MDASKIVLIIIPIFYIPLIIFAGKKAGSNLHPALLFSILWSILSFFPQVLILNVHSSFLAFIYVYALAFCLIIPILIRGRVVFGSAKNQASALNGRRLYRLLCIFSLVSIVSSVLMLLQNGFDFSQIIFNLLKSSGNYAAMRGNEGIEYGAIGVVNVSFTYVCAALSGLILGLGKNLKRSYIFLFLGLGPPVFLMISQSSKLIFLLSLSYFFGGYLLGMMREGRQISMDTIKPLLKYAFLFIPFIMFSFLSRNHYHDNYSDTSFIVDSLYGEVLNYFAAEIYGFSDFFMYYIGFDSIAIYSTRSVNPGEYTFFSIYDFFGLADSVLPSFYDEVYPLGDIVNTVQFTMFRGLITDFGILGSFVVFTIFGFIFDQIFRLSCGRWSGLFAQSLYVNIVAAIFFSYILSIFMAKFPILVTIVLYFCLRYSTVFVVPKNSS